MKFCARATSWALLLGVLTLSGGCRYFTNRYYDARDIISIGAGVTAQNPITGPVPPSLGLYFEATDWLHLGAIHFNGYTAECDLRGTFVGPERETRYGLLWWQMIQKNQSYADACYVNKFKDEDFAWCHRMESLGLRFGGHPAKRLHYERYRTNLIYGSTLLHRGWHYWEYAGFEAAISEPLFTHAGIMLRAGFDFSEIPDFLLGWAGLDMNRDDMNRDEYLIYLNNPMVMGQKMVPVRARTPEPACDEKKAEPKATKTELKKDEVKKDQPAPVVTGIVRDLPPPAK